MKKITNILPQKNDGRVNIFLDNSFAFGLDMEIYLKYGLTKGMELDDKFIEDILKAEVKSKALNTAIILLGRKDRTEMEVTKKLQDKEYDSSTIKYVIDKLKEYKYINDESYCQKFINDKIKFSKYGKNKIKTSLYQKGVDKTIISQSIDTIDNDEEYERALIIGEKKFKTYKETDKYKLKSKLFSFLVSRGYDFDVANKVIRELIK